MFSGIGSSERRSEQAATWAGRAALFSGILLFEIVFYFQWSDDNRAVLAPVLLVTTTVMFTSFMLHAQERRFPLADIGFVCMVASAIYIALPLLFYVLSGSEWTRLSDYRLQLLQPGTAELAPLGWDGVIYLDSFGLAYLLMRGRPFPAPGRPQVAEGEVIAVIFILVFCLIYQLAIESIYSIRLVPTESDVQLLRDTPYPVIIAQLNNVLLNVGRIAKLYFAVFLVINWRRNAGIRVLLLGWLALEVALAVHLQGARTYAALLIIAALLSYHWFVKPLSIPAVIVSGACLVTALLAYGYYRDFRSASIEDPFSANNEFQVLLGTAIDIKSMAASGVMVAPWQVRWGELVNWIPRQLLTFNKIDPSDWYLTFVPNDSSGLMFGVMGQAAVGAGRLELALRGLALGAVLAIVHRVFARPGRPIMRYVFYIWLTALTYYTYRATTFYALNFIILFFVPFFLMTRILALVLGKTVRFSSLFDGRARERP